MKSSSENGQAEQGGGQEQWEAMLAELMLAQLQSLGVLADADSVAVGELKARLAPLYGRWLDESLRVLTLQGRVQSAAPDQVRLGTGVRDAAAVWADWEARKAVWLADPDQVARITLVESTLRALPEILAGRKLATDVLFRQSSMDGVSGIYKDNTGADLFNSAIADTVVAYIEERIALNPAAPPRIRIVEVGAGTGGTTAPVLRKLSKYAELIEEYCFTDISVSFLQHAEKQFGPGNPFLRYRLLDVERPIEGQDVQLGSYDLAIATNVLHATRNIRNTLRNVKATLRRSGLLLLNEMSNSGGLFAHLTFGLLKGWWAYEDDALRIPGCPGLYPETWQHVLQSEGFDAVYFPLEEFHALGQMVAIAESDGVVRQREAEPARPVRRKSAAAAPVAAPAAQPDTAAATAAAPAAAASGVSATMAEDHVCAVIIDKLAEVLEIDAEDISRTESFADYGVDSISGGRLVQLINAGLGIELETISLFDYASVKKLAGLILSRFGAQIAAGLGLEAQAAAPAAAPAAAAAPAPAPAAPRNAFGSSDLPGGREPVAVIGIAGRFAQSRTPAELWRHLVEGRDLVEEVGRWSLGEDAQLTPNGGFLSGLAEFDPLFFNISGIEATYMDPQQRLFLQESWRALEDSGYAGSGERERNWGVYVGTESSGEYAQLFSGEPPAQALWGNNVATLPARLSYFLDLQGPAVTINTACSSSLVAIHHAVQGLWLGDVEMAIAGGVTLHMTPTGYTSLSRAGMLSADGRCYTFDDRANGFVPAEAVGAVVLKRLSNAEADGDHVYGVIRGSALNQDGTTNGITAPSGNAQERLERYVYDTFALDPARLQMVEAHGTATELGDPIEFSALTRAFRHYTDKRNYCAIGSIKTNIGHATAAAGFVGLVKVLLSLKHRQIPASLNYRNANPKLNVEASPFYINTALREWEPQRDAHGAALPRQAALSSFGMSGTNAHMVLEESPLQARTPPALPGQLIVLSARTEDQLQQQARQLLDYLRGDDVAALGNIAYTLLLGRRHLSHRLACVARSREDLENLLQRWLDKGSASQVYAGKFNEKQRREQPALKRYAQDCLQRCRSGLPAAEHLECLATAADLHVQGYELDFAQLFTAQQYSRVSLPGYPFARETYWVAAAAPEAAPRGTAAAAQLHPLVHQNTSVLDGQRFRSRFLGDETCLAAGTAGRELPHALLPALGTAALHLAQAFGAAAAPVQWRELAWAQPLEGADFPLTLEVELYRAGRDQIGLEIYREDGAARRVLAQGKASAALPSAPAALDLGVLQSQGSAAPAPPQRLGKLSQLRLAGPDFLALARLELSAAASADTALAQLELLDAGLHLIDTAAPLGDARWQPLSLAALHTYRPVPAALWLLLRAAGEARYDLIACDERGDIVVSADALAVTAVSATVRAQGAAAAAPEAADLLLLAPGTVAAAAPDLPSPAAVHVVRLCAVGEAAQLAALRAALPQADCDLLDAGEGDVTQRFAQAAAALLDTIRQVLADHARGDIVLQVVVPAQSADAGLRGLSGLLKSVHLEQPRLRTQLIVVAPGVAAAELAARLRVDLPARDDSLVDYGAGSRTVEYLRELTPPAAAPVVWREGGVYLISGGAGGLGQFFARDIASHLQAATVVLTGRTPASAARHAEIAALQQAGVRIEYAALDVADRAAVAAFVADLLARHGRLDGVIHSAGVLEDSFLQHKDRANIARVFAPKIDGAAALDEATAGIALDFFVLFAAAAGVFGNVGQSDYAAANAYLDSFAAVRQRQVEAGLRHGRSLAIDWPLWAEGGMRMPESSVAAMREMHGLWPLPAAPGVRAFHRALACAAPQVLVLYGEPTRLRRQFLQLATAKTAPITAAAPVRAHSENVDKAALRERVLHKLKAIFARVAKLALSDIDGDEPLEKYGIDSILVTQLNQEFGAVFGELSKTLLYEYQSLGELAGHFVAEHEAACVAWCEAAPSAAAPAAKAAMGAAVTRGGAAQVLRSWREGVPVRSGWAPQQREPIAIIGLTGRYPQAPDLAAFWHNLREGRDCISEIPAGRWNADKYYEPDRETAIFSGKYYAKSGGFLEGFDEFDPLFFGVAPREAYDMDPQERLFTQSCWATLEDAGYTRERLAAQHKRNVGVFAGITKTGFELHGPQLMADGEGVFPHTSFGSMANRVSYLLNLSGPSMPVDTMCSSSLTAIHEACEHLYRGECELALAGGVNLYLHASNFISLATQRMLASDGRCRSFGAGGDGFVPGEGVGTVLLKPLSAAQRDGDSIYALIRGTAINHGGKTNGYTVPSPVSQAEVVRAALDKGGVNAADVSYIEAHGTGTSLGDPIEITGLSQAFGRD
ncbi:SDR family NAD(P)-dependent oxidoreductase, partial [Tahibacter harae]